MIQKHFITSIILIATISGCSLLPTKKVEINSKPIQIDIMQPSLPRPVELTAPQLYVVSEAVITNPCRRTIPYEPKKFNDEGVEQFKRPKTCNLDERDNPDWPVGYTYMDRFLDEMKELKTLASLQKLY